MFLDEVNIAVQAGNGGNGCTAFRRERFVAKGGPSGGNGGDGGDIIAVIDPSMHTLFKIGRKKHYKAENGRPGEGSNRHGKNGRNLIIPMPHGTEIWDEDKDILIKDLVESGRNVVLAAGGKGGRGNASFATSTNQSPRVFTRGERGETRNLHLTLKLLADVGLVGLPNAGKSTLLARMTQAKPKIASYPFSTRHPCLGVVMLDGGRAFTVADIPGLITGAHRGTGLGDEFLRHIERTAVLAFVLAVQDCKASNPIDAYRILDSEIRAFSGSLAEKPRLIIMNKMDLDHAEDGFRNFVMRYPDADVVGVSALLGTNLETLGWTLFGRVASARVGGKVAGGLL